MTRIVSATRASEKSTRKDSDSLAACDHYSTLTEPRKTHCGNLKCCPTIPTHSAARPGRRGAIGPAAPAPE
eukprot:565942-Hanusia_phi.AAC.1